MSQESFAFFDQRDTLERILFLYGRNIEDSFFVSGTMQNSMEYMLECHLKKMGYDLVLFYNGIQNLYCYSQSMARKRDEFFMETRAADTARSREIDDELNSFLGGEESGAPAPEEDVSLRTPIDDLQIATFLDRVMRREDVHTAIVFSDGWDLLENTDNSVVRTLTHYFRSWYHFGANNRNIAILCFSTLTQAHLNAAVEHVPSWSFLRDKIVQGNTFSSAVKYISIPGRDEIEGRLRLEPAYRKLGSEAREQAISSVQYRLHDMGNMLKGFDEYLRNTPDAVQQLVENDEDDEEAWEILRTTRGWENVATTVERIAKTVQISGTGPVQDVQRDVMTRMTESQPFQPAGICLNLVLKGNPGTGKTTIAKLLGRIFRQLKLLPSGHVVETSRDDLVGRYVGHTAGNTRAKIEEAMGGILFIDEAYSLYRMDDNHGDFGVEAIDTLIEAMTRSVGSFSVVLAGYPEEMEHMLNANPGFRSRFGHNIITIEDYQPELLQEIATKYLATQYARSGYTFDPSLLTPGVTGTKPLDVFFRGWFNARNRKHFGNARDCHNLIDVLANQVLDRGGKTIIQEDFPPELRQYFKEADLDVNHVLASLDDIVGQDEVKEKLLSIVRRLRLRNRQHETRPDVEQGKIVPGHYLFCGNPGTGKSTISDKFAQVLGALRITGRFKPTRVTGTMLINAMQQRGITGMRELIENARGGVLFIDEAHQLIQTPVALQLLLDPMLEMREDLCVILACYERDVEPLFFAEPGLRSRLSGIFHFADYTVDELVQIFEKKAAAAGYSLAGGVLEQVSLWLEARMSRDTESHNGRYTEQLLMQVEENMAGRMERRGDLPDEELFVILPEDILKEEDEAGETMPGKQTGNSVDLDNMIPDNLL